MPVRIGQPAAPLPRLRSEEHTSELQSQSNLVCRLLLEKKKHTSVRASVVYRSVHTLSCQSPRIGLSIFHFRVRAIADMRVSVFDIVSCFVGTNVLLKVK